MTRVWHGGRDQADVWRIERPAASPLHPVMKPLALYERAIENSSEPGGLVLTPSPGRVPRSSPVSAPGADDLEEALPAKQGALMALDEQERFASSEAFLRSVFERPPERTPLVRIARAARAHARTRLTDATPAMIEAAEREATRDAYFYVHLIGGLQIAADRVIHRNFFVAMALFGQMRRITLEWEAAMKSYEPERSVTPHTEEWETWRDRVADLELALYVEAEARRIEQRYLDGHEVLLAEQVEKLAVIGEVTDFLVSQCRDIAYQFGLEDIVNLEDARPPLDREALRRDAEPLVEAVVARIVDSARAEALSAIEEHADSLAYVRRHALGRDPETR